VSSSAFAVEPRAGTSSREDNPTCRHPPARCIPTGCGSPWPAHGAQVGSRRWVACPWVARVAHLRLLRRSAHRHQAAVLVVAAQRSPYERIASALRGCVWEAGANPRPLVVSGRGWRPGVLQSGWRALRSSETPPCVTTIYARPGGTARPRATPREDGTWVSVQGRLVDRCHISLTPTPGRGRVNYAAVTTKEERCPTRSAST
jgi:hypothetical protein